MIKLRMTEDAALAFVGGLLSIMRVDHVIGPSDSVALQRVLAQWLEYPVDIADAMFTETTPESLVEAVANVRGSYRDQAMSSRREIAVAFIAAANEIATTTDALGGEQIALINRYADALAVDGIEPPTYTMSTK